MKITVSGEVDYRPQHTTRASFDDPQSVQEWLGDIRKLVGEVAKELYQATGSGAPVGVSVVLDQQQRHAVVIGESEL